MDLPSARHKNTLTLRPEVEKLLLQNATYSPKMRFILEHKEKRLFVTERFCFRGSVDDWIYLGGPDSLSQEAKKLKGK
jgi:hypothetical protein